MVDLLKKDNMHDYQRYASQYIKDHPVSAILLSMGLGKTIITLTALNDLLFDSFDAHKVLVVGPLRVGYVWQEETRKWDHLKEIRFSLALGSEAQRLSALRKKADVYYINRENLQWLIYESGVKFDFDTVVLDELSSFKNHQAKRFRAMLSVRPKVKRIIGLTGTPSSNGLMDLWAEYRLLDMGERLGRYLTRYRLKYFEPDKRSAQVVFSYKPIEGAEEAIYQAISDITISMKATDFLKMPERIFSEYPVYLSESEQKAYKDLKDNLLLDNKDVTAANAGVLTMKLSQMANGAVYNEEGQSLEIHNRKLDALEDIIEASGGQPILLAYWFKHDRDRIAERLKSLKVNFQDLDSPKSIQDWNAGKIQVALIHPASAGHGLNLQDGGSTLVWFGLTWSLELYQQTNARLWRQGQKARTVVIQHIIAKNTIDERILKVLQTKEQVQDALIEAVKAEIGGSDG